MNDLPINDDLTVPATAFEWTAVRASGAGGQNVNKVSSKVDLRLDLSAFVLPEAARVRLVTANRRRLDADGRLLVTSQRYRDQHKNLEDALEKVRALLLAALEAPKPRLPTRVPRYVVARRLKDKAVTSSRKAARKLPEDEG